MRPAIFAQAICILLASYAWLPTAASAQQSSIAGLVTDASGSVLPGVTVEASSPALIEKTRVVTTDGTGQYRIVDLRPGVYSVTFQLPSFSTVRRDGIELSVKNAISWSHATAEHPRIQPGSATIPCSDGSIRVELAGLRDEKP